MPTPSTSLELFGLDLRQLWRDYRAAWQSVGRSRLLSWLTPAIAVQVLRADGTHVLWRGGRRPTGRADDQTRTKAAYQAVEIAEDLVLRKRLRMPDLPVTALAQAAAVEVNAVNPFRASDVVWQWHAAPIEADGVRWVEIVLASRTQVTSFLETQSARLPDVQGVEPEAWVFATDGSALVLQGWGESRRLQHAARQRHLAYGLLIVALALLAGMALTPSLQLRARSLQAIAAFGDLQRAAAPAVAQRESFTRSVENLEALRAVLAQRVDLLKLLAVLTQALPDDTYLQGVQAQEMKVAIQGLTADSASLMQTLGAVQGFKEVRAPMAATRAHGANAENFRLEIQLDPTVFALTAEAAAPQPPPQAIPAAPVPPVEAVPAADATTSRKSKFTSGG